MVNKSVTEKKERERKTKRNITEDVIDQSSLHPFCNYNNNNKEKRKQSNSTLLYRRKGLRMKTEWTLI